MKAYSVPGHVLSTWDTSVHKAGKNTPPSMGLHFKITC